MGKDIYFLQTEISMLAILMKEKFREKVLTTTVKTSSKEKVFGMMECWKFLTTYNKY